MTPEAVARVYFDLYDSQPYAFRATGPTSGELDTQFGTVDYTIANRIIEFGEAR